VVSDTQNDRVQNLALKKEITDLKRMLLAYENAHTPPSKSRKKREPKEPTGKIGAKTGHEKWDRKEPEPTKTVEYTQNKCAKCGAKLGKPDFAERRITEETPEPRPVQVIENLINHYTCKCCGKENVAPNNIPKGRFGFNLQAHATLLRFDDRLPLRKAVNALERHYQIFIKQNAKSEKSFKLYKTVKEKLKAL